MVDDGKAIIKVPRSKLGCCTGCVYDNRFGDVCALCNDEFMFAYAPEVGKDKQGSLTENKELSKREKIALACLQGYLSCALDHKGVSTIPERVVLCFRYADEFLKQSKESNENM